MADISKDELRKEITAILKDADLTATSSKKVRQELEEKLDCDLISRKKEIDDLVMEYVHSKDKKNKKKPQQDSEEEEEEEEDEEEEEESEEEKKPAKRGAAASKKTPAKKAKKASSDDSASEGSEAESDEEYSPKKAKPPKGRKLPPKKKKGSDSDSDEDWGKSAKKSGGGGKKAGGAKRGGGGGYTKAHNLSPELASLMGQDVMARHEVVKKIWQIIKERDLYDPKNKQFAICDDDLFKVMGVKRFRTFGMMKYLKTHFVD